MDVPTPIQKEQNKATFTNQDEVVESQIIYTVSDGSMDPISGKAVFHSLVGDSLSKWVFFIFILSGPIYMKLLN